MTEPSSVIGELPAELLAADAVAAPSRPAARSLRADAALLVVTVIWGGTFVMVKDAVAYYPVFGFLVLRFGIAAAVLLPFVVLRPRFRRVPGVEPLGGQPAKASTPGYACAITPHLGEVLRRNVAPLLIGLALFAGYAFQTFGLDLTTPAKAGFITGLGVVMVPLASALLLGRAPTRPVWLGVAMATAGLALLTLDATLAVNVGDILVLFCAASFAIHILLTGRYAPGHDPLRLLFGQVVVVTALSLVATLLFETRPALTGQVWFAAAFTGLFATAVAFGVQTVAQRFTTPTHTALIFAAEPVFAALFSFLLIGEVLGPRQLAGCGLILAGMVAAELRPVRTRCPVPGAKFRVPGSR